MNVGNARGPQIEYDLFKLAQRKWSRDAASTVQQALHKPGHDNAPVGSAYDSDNPFGNLNDTFVSSITDDDVESYNLNDNYVNKAHNFGQIEDKFTRSPEPTWPEFKSPGIAKTEAPGKAGVHTAMFDQISKRIQNNPGFQTPSTEKVGGFRPSNYSLPSVQQTNILPKSIQQKPMMNAVDGLVNFVSVVLG
jgi:hypothetical protein